MSAPAPNPRALWDDGANMDAVQTAALVSIAESLAAVRAWIETPPLRVVQGWPEHDPGYGICVRCGKNRIVATDMVCERCRITDAVVAARPMENAAATAEEGSESNG